MTQPTDPIPDQPADQPHAPDVIERETSDEGFSAGWGLHMKPSVAYWLDCHTHVLECEPDTLPGIVADWHDFMWGHRLRRHVAVDGVPEYCQTLSKVAREDDRFLWLCRMWPDGPDADHLRRCKELGAVGLKLHNARLITRNMDHRLVLSPQWHEVYDLAGKLGMPIIWHVTQRLSDSPYTGGGSHSYWKEGLQKGHTYNYTNADLLDDFLEVVAAHRQTNFIGAHQLHMGPDRLASLFDAHPNLYVDTSIGCFVTMDDDMYEQDRRRWRQFVLAYPDRLLFGTDVMLGSETVNTELLRQHFLGHVRWVKQLNLPQDALSKIAHQNFERLAGLQTPAMFSWGALRP